MIRFIDLKNQICDGVNNFAFYDTITDTFCVFGEEDQQVFDSIDEFTNVYDKEKEGDLRPLSRFLNLIPTDYFSI